MIGQTLSLVGALYGAIGPGLILILAAALPLLLLALTLVVRAGVKRQDHPGHSSR